MTFPIVPVVSVLAVFGLPYLVIYLQGHRLAAVEAELRRLTAAIGDLSERRVNLGVEAAE